MQIKKWARASLNWKHVVTLGVASLVCAASAILFSNKLASLYTSVDFLSSRRCSYSVVLDKDVGEDAYAFYNKKIFFSQSPNVENRINGIVLMETGNRHTDSDYFDGYNPASLNEREVLISKNLAENNKISVGTRLYTKSNLNGNVESHLVKGIFPDAYGFNDQVDNLTQGVILMGQSSTYLSNAQTEYVYFFDKDESLINASGAHITGSLCNLKTQKKNLLGSYAYYASIETALVIITTTIMFVLLWSFNEGVYLKKKQFGVLSLTSWIVGSQTAYLLSSAAIAVLLYLLFSAFSRFYWPMVVLIIAAYVILDGVVSFFGMRRLKGR